MIKKIFHIIYNERRENSWIVVEIIAASIMLWMAFDPLFTLARHDNIEDGYDIDGTYMIDFAHYEPYDYRYNRANWEAEAKTGESYIHLHNIVRNLPEIESYCFTTETKFPGGNQPYFNMGYFRDSINLGGDQEKLREIIRNESLAFNTHEVYNIEGNNYFTTFRVKDALTGEIFKPRKDDTEGNIYVSENLAKEFYGSASEAIGKKIYYGDAGQTISGVFKDMQLIDYCTPPQTIIRCKNVQPAEYRMINLHIRLKKGVDRVAFEKRFKEEIMPDLKAGNAYCQSFTPNEIFREQMNETREIPSKLTMYNSMALFSLFTVFLGMLSAFWIRTSARKSEIGIMRSVGASRQAIIKQFVTEVALLVNIGFAVAMLFVLHYLYVNGFTNPLDGQINIKFVDIGGPLHFAAVTAATYIILMLFAIAGAAIPAWRITKILPADALKEE